MRRMRLVLMVAVWSLSVLFGALRTGPALAQDDAAAPRQPADYTSTNFLVHSDLAPADAKDLLGRLETMLKLISAYWGKPLRGPIECYVVKDLKNWPPGSIPSEEGRSHIESGAGVTISQKITRGNQFVAKAVVFAVADRGTPQHEAVHAYCGQTFGTTGPVWYSEGMAEMGQYWRQGDNTVNCHPYVVEYIRGSPPKSLNEIVNGNEFTGDSWQNYAWRWALCHLLANNPNYSDRFRPLGLGILEEREVTFEQVYGSMAAEISFEYLFFLEHLDIGYRVDLCRWDWKKKFVPLRSASPVTVKVEAARGWQPTGVVATAGTEYEFSAGGTWKTGKEGEATTADGGTAGEGRLVGVLMQDLQLGEPFDLGSFGSFAAPGDGKLYLRCQDEWHQLADNSGKLSVKLKLKGKGNPLQPPKASGTRPATVEEEPAPAVKATPGG